MTDHNDEHDHDELLRAYVDGDVTADARALVEGDPQLLAAAERLRAVRAELAAVEPPRPERREATIDAALAVFDEEASTSATSPVVPIARRGPSRWLQPLAAAAAVVAVVVAGFAIARRGGDEPTADRDDAARATTQPAAAAAPAPATTVAAADADAALAPAAPEVTEDGEELAQTPMAESAIAALAVIRDRDDLALLATDLAAAVEDLGTVLERCAEGGLGMADAVFVDDGTEREIVVALVDGGWAAIDIDRCTVVLTAEADR